MDEDIFQLKQRIEKARRIAFLGGAGISTESGIPDFRSESGIFKAVEAYGFPPETLLSHSYFLRHTDVFYDYYRKFLLCPDAVPNEGHKALARLEQTGKLTAVITQNIDGLHQQAGSKNVLELHGSVYRNHCMKCNKAYTLADVMAQTGVPRCSCGGIIKPDVVLYEEELDPDTLRQSIQHIARADLLIIGGTSLKVYPAAGLADYFSGNSLVVINLSDTGRDTGADLVIHKKFGEVMGQIV